MTASVSPPMRISSGSSTVTRSSRGDAAPASYRTMRVPRTGSMNRRISLAPGAARPGRLSRPSRFTPQVLANLLEFRRSGVHLHLRGSSAGLGRDSFRAYGG